MKHTHLSTVRYNEKSMASRSIIAGKSNGSEEVSPLSCQVADIWYDSCIKYDRRVTYSGTQFYILPWSNFPLASSLTGSWPVINYAF
jgi:hypothetical protein